ncbi:MAG: alpha/beta hydrolase [Acetobacteraceae bacterium]|nr:alpha/beta hydrolase [Acetobacteraceae bacterium]
MASLQAYLAAFMVRRQVRRSLGGMENLGRVRAVFEGARIPAPRGVRYRSESLGGIPGEWVESDSPARDAGRTTLLYIHGGGFVACSPRTHRPITGWFAAHGFRVFAPDYRLAPEHPFPAAVEDVVAAWRGLQAAVPGGAVVAGDSAGGTLALALMLALRDAGAMLPGGAALFSPGTDLAGTGDSMRTNARRDAMFRSDAIHHLADAYLGGADPRIPLASPLYADLAGLPPLLIHVGEREILRDDSTRLAERARAAGVKVDLRVWPVVPHVWQFAHVTVPEARRSLAAAATFLHQAGAVPRTAPKEYA